MSTEEIKLIVDLLNNATQGAKEVIIWIIAKDFIISLLGYVLATIAFIFAYKLAKYIVGSQSFGGQVADLLNVDTYYTYEQKRGIAKLTKLLKE